MFHVEHQVSVEIVPIARELFHVEQFGIAPKRRFRTCSTWNDPLPLPILRAHKDVPRGTKG